MINPRLAQDRLTQAKALIAERLPVAFEPAFDGGGAFDSPQGCVFHVPSLDGYEVLMDELFAEVVSLGCYVFMTEPEEAGLLCGLVPTNDQFEAVRLVGTADPNGDRTTADIVDWLRRLHDDHPLSLTGLSSDRVQGLFVEPLTDPDSVRERIVSFAPETAHGLFEDEDDLLAMLSDDSAFALWWD